jgi:hypothetical protein
MDEPRSNSPKEEVTAATRNDINAAADILDTRKKAMDDIIAGRPAPYFFAPSPHPANSVEPARCLDTEIFGRYSMDYRLPDSVRVFHSRGK